MEKKLRIAQVGSLWESTPPPKYGGTERIVSFLTERLVAKGHEVTLFASGDSKTAAKLVSVHPRPLFRDNIPWTNLMYPLLNISEAFERADQFDIIHVHLNKSSDYLALPLSEQIKHRTVFTLHFPYPVSQGRTDRHLVLQKFRDRQFISISNAARRGGENLNWVATVYNGIDLTPYQFHAQPKEYFVWIGKFNPDKGVHLAIEAAQATGVKLILGGKLDTLESEDRKYYEEKIAPHIDEKHVTYVGEVNDAQKNELLGNAVAFLNPIQWNEPFGLVMVESMACGTPVISFRAGSAPELIEDGVTGFIVETVADMVKHMQDIPKLDRKKSRERVEQHFSADVMTKSYLAAYESILKLLA